MSAYFCWLALSYWRLHVSYIDKIIKNKIVHPRHDTDIAFVHGLGRPSGSGEVGNLYLCGIASPGLVTFANPAASLVQVRWNEYSGHSNQYYYVAFDEGQWLVRFVAESTFLTTPGTFSATLGGTFVTGSNFVTVIGASGRAATGSSNTTSGAGRGGAGCKRAVN